MASGAPDWFGAVHKSEVVVRPTIVYPTGRVILYDNFEREALQWTPNGDAGYTAELRTTEAYNGTTSAFLETGSTETTRYARMTRFVGQPPTNKVGFEAHFRLANQTGYYLVFGLTNNYLAATRGGAVRYDVDNAKWQYRIVGATWVDVTDGAQTLAKAAFAFHHMKLTIDSSTNQYLELKVNDRTFDLTGIGSSAFFTATGETTVIGVYVSSGTNDNRSVYIDDVVVTAE